MTSTETCHYRGYDIQPQRQWSSWCVSIYPSRADLPLLPRSTLDTLTAQKQDALDEARKTVDCALSELADTLL
jgi:hypothetical protein